MNKIAFFKPKKARSYRLVRPIRLAMAELSPNGLSEQWFLRYGGDAHWQLIAKACGQDKAMFKDMYGRNVYAAFCATNIEFEPVENLLAEDASITSDIYQVGSCQIGSIHHILLEGKCIARLYMISSFVSHQDGGSNQKIVRNKHMPNLDLENAPENLVQIADYARMVARKIAQYPSKSSELGEFIGEAKPCPSLDFNAVGLLYFPTFSKLTETAHWQWAASRGQWAASKKECETALAPLKSRIIVYLGNMDIGQSLLFFKSGHQTSIKRCDGAYIAHVLTETHLA